MQALPLPPGIRLTKWLKYVNVRRVGLYGKPVSRRMVVNYGISASGSISVYRTCARGSLDTWSRASRAIGREEVRGENRRCAASQLPFVAYYLQINLGFRHRCLSRRAYEQYVVYYEQRFSIPFKATVGS